MNRRIGIRTVASYLAMALAMSPERPVREQPRREEPRYYEPAAQRLADAEARRKRKNAKRLADAAAGGWNR